MTRKMRPILITSDNTYVIVFAKMTARLFELSGSTENVIKYTCVDADNCSSKPIKEMAACRGLSDITTDQDSVYRPALLLAYQASSLFACYSEPQPNQDPPGNRLLKASKWQMLPSGSQSNRGGESGKIDSSQLGHNWLSVALRPQKPY